MAIDFNVISNEMLSSTLYDLSDDVVNGLFQRTPLLDLLRQKEEVMDGGWNKTESYIVRDHAEATNIESGWERIELAAQDMVEIAEFKPTRFIFPVLISNLEESKNSGGKAIVKLADMRYRQQMDRMIRRMNRQFVVGDTAQSALGTLNGSNGGFIYAGTSAQAATDGNTIGGLARGLAPVLHNQHESMGGAFNLDSLYDIDTTIGLRRPEQGDGGVYHLVLCAPRFFREYRSTLQAQERYIDAKSVDAMGAPKLAFGGAIMTPDIELGSGVSYGGVSGDTDNVGALFINCDGLHLNTYGSDNFRFSGFIDHPDYDGRYATITYQGVLSASHLYSQGVVTYSF